MHSIMLYLPQRASPPLPPRTVGAGFVPLYTAHGVYKILNGRGVFEFKRDREARQLMLNALCAEFSYDSRTI